MILNMISDTKYDIIIHYVSNLNKGSILSIACIQININTLKNNKLEF